jgi:hypothetical protein
LQSRTGWGTSELSKLGILINLSELQFPHLQHKGNAIYEESRRCPGWHLLDLAKPQCVIHKLVSAFWK